MKSLNAQVKQLHALVGTNDLSRWETDFLESINQRTNGGSNTASLSKKQIEAIEWIYRKHFGDDI